MSIRLQRECSTPALMAFREKLDFSPQRFFERLRDRRALALANAGERKREIVDVGAILFQVAFPLALNIPRSALPALAFGRFSFQLLSFFQPRTEDANAANHCPFPFARICEIRVSQHSTFNPQPRCRHI